MRKLFLVTGILLCVLLSGFGQDGGIVFEKPDWKKVVKKAQKEKKLIFVDCYTERCGPCKLLVKNVFPRKGVGEFYNQHFVSVKFDINKDADGKKLAEIYKPEGVPTLLFFDPNTEELLHRVIGGGDSAYILNNGKLALDGENNLRGLERRYVGGERGSEFMARYLQLLSKADMSAKYKDVMNRYFDGLTEAELCEPANWKIFAVHVDDLLAPTFQRYMALEEKLYLTVPKVEVDKVLNEKLVEAVYSVVTVSKGRKYTLEEQGQLATYLRSVYFSGVPAVIAMLEIHACRVKKDSLGVWNRIRQAYELNVFGREYSYLDYLCVYGMLDLHEMLKDEKSLKEVADLCDRLLAKGHSMDDYQAKLMMVKERVLATLGN